MLYGLKTRFGIERMNALPARLFSAEALMQLVGFKAQHVSGLPVLQIIADPDRMVKMGWSAGGHMTNKIITFTDRFKAASSGAGVAQWVSMYAQTDTRVNRTLQFGGTPPRPCSSFSLRRPTVRRPLESSFPAASIWS